MHHVPPPGMSPHTPHHAQGPEDPRSQHWTRQPSLTRIAPRARGVLSRRPGQGVLPRAPQGHARQTRRRGREHPGDAGGVGSQSAEMALASSECETRRLVDSVPGTSAALPHSARPTRPTTAVAFSRARDPWTCKGRSKRVSGSTALLGQLLARLSLPRADALPPRPPKARHVS